MASAFRWYQTQLKVKPLLTQSLTTAVLFGTGDVMAQQLVEKQGFDKHNYARTLRMVGYGGLVFGPAATTWFGWLQRNIAYSSTLRTAVTRVALDQAVFTPINLTFFLSTMATLENPTTNTAVVKQNIEKKIKSTWWEALKKNWLIWPAVQGVNFTVVPVEMRVLVVNIVALGWNCYLSYLNSGGGGGGKKIEQGKTIVEGAKDGIEYVQEGVVEGILKPGSEGKAKRS